MLIACPVCDAKYDIKSPRPGGRGKRVRCAICDHRWLEHAPALEAAPLVGVVCELDALASRAGPEIRVDATSERFQPLGLEKPQPAAPRQQNPAKPTFRLPLPSRGVLAAGLCLAIGMFAIAQRMTIARFVPHSARVYAAIGLPVNPRGLELRHVQSRYVDEGSRQVLAVEGEIANVRSDLVKLPQLRLAVRAPDGREIYFWTSPPPQHALRAGETAPFRARLASPPIEGRDVKVQFASIEVGKNAHARP